LQHASPAAELAAILESPRAPALVRELPSVQLHRLVAALGRVDSAELLALASPAQVRELLDLELWEGDRVQVAEAYDWLQALAGLGVPGRRDLASLDVELLGYLILARARVHLVEDPDEEWDPRESEAQLWKTPDGWFLLEVESAERADAEQLIAVVEALYAEDLDLTRRLLQSLVWELPLELEEMSYRWRNGRLQDLGFADPEEALLLYAHLDPASVRVDEGTADRPLRADPEAAPSSELVRILPAADSFWQRAVARVEDDAERERLAGALLAVSNRAITADRVDPSDEEGIRRSLDGLLWRLSLGLERLTGGDEARAPAVLAGVALLRVARVGHSVVLDARRRLLPPLRVGTLGSAPGRLDRLAPPLSLQLAGLAAPRPSCYDAARRAPRPFHTLAELTVAAGWIDRALAAAGLLARLGLLPSAAPAAGGRVPAGLTFGDLYRTQVANRLLGRVGLRPLDGEALARLLREHARPAASSAREAALREAASRLAPGREGASPLEAAWIEEWLAELEEKVGRLDPEQLDLRFVEGLWLVRAQG